jgi:hypothetical protein
MTRDAPAVGAGSAPTPFQLFSLELRQEKVHWPERLSPCEIARRVAQAWFELSPADKVTYYERAGARHKISSDIEVSGRGGGGGGSDCSSVGDCNSRRSRGPTSTSASTNTGRSSDQSGMRYTVDSLGRRRPIRSQPARSANAAVATSTSTSTPSSSRQPRSTVRVRR